MKDKNFKLDVRVNAEEAAKRISSAISKEVFLTILRPQGDKLLVGKIEGDSFWVRKQKNYRNSWSPLLCGKITPADFGCTLRGQFRLQTFTSVFTIVWFGMAFFFLAIGIMMIRLELLKNTFNPKILFTIFVPLLLIGWWICLAIWGKRQGRYEADDIRDIMAELFNDALLKADRE